MESAKVKYAFLLPAYKAKYFEESLGSILAQTYTDFSVIVSDDCSFEDLNSIVDKFGDSRVIYRRNESNIGAARLVEHWNMLLGLTEADYIVMASDDDIYAPDYLEKMDRLVRSHPDIRVFRPRICLIDGGGQEFWRERYPVEDEVIGRNQYLSLFSEERMASGIPQYLFDRKALLEIGGFTGFPYAWFSDDATVMLLGRGGMALSPDFLFRFRISGASISAVKTADDAAWKGKLTASVKYYDLISGLPDLPEDVYVRLETRIRKLTIQLLNEATFKTFVRMMLYIKDLGSALYPFAWRARRYVGHIYHGVVGKA